MTSESPPSPDPQQPLPEQIEEQDHFEVLSGALPDFPTLAHRIGIVPIGLFIAFVAAVLYRIYPVSLLRPEWQLTFCGVIIDHASLPLAGMALLHLAFYLDPQNPFLERRRRLCSRLAVAAVLGFLLIIPLQAYAGWKSYRSATSSQSREITEAKQRLEQFRRVIEESGSAEEIQNRLQQLNAPNIGPIPGDQPLPAVKQRLLDSLEGAENIISDRVRQSGPGQLINLVLSNLRVLITAFGYAIGFAATAQRKQEDLSLLQEFWLGRMGGEPEPPPPGEGPPPPLQESEDPFLEELGFGEGEPDQPPPPR